MRKRRPVCLILIAVALCLLCCPVGVAMASAPGGELRAAPGSYRLRLRADPQRVPADGKSQVVITVEVTDSQGLPPAAGIAVYLVTSLGEIVSPVQAVGGLAQTVLTASSRPGMALVSAIVGPTRSTLQVEFLARSGSAPAGERLVTLSADEVAYSPDKRLFVASSGGFVARPEGPPSRPPAGGLGTAATQGARGLRADGGPPADSGGAAAASPGKCKLRYQGLTCTADGMQYDMERGVVCAQGNVVLRKGQQELKADALRYDLVTLCGRLLRVSPSPGSGGNVERLVVEGPKLETRPDTEANEALWEPMNTDDTRTWVKARRAIVEPGEKIILDHATFYVDGSPVMSLRRHVLEPGAGAGMFGDALGYTTGSGVNLDLPWYYRAGEHHTGSLHLTRNRSVNGSRYDGGWAMGLREEYLREGRLDGSFQLDDVTNPRRGIRWEHSHVLGGGARVDLDASAFRFDDDSPDFLTQGLTYWRPVSRGSLMLALSRTEYGDSLQNCGELAYRLPTFTAKGSAMVTPALHLRSSRAESTAQGLLIDATTGEPVVLQQAAQRATSLGADVNIESVGRDLGHRTRLTWGLTTGYFRALGATAGARPYELDTRISLDRTFDARNRAGLTYTFSANPNGSAPSIFSNPPRQMVGLHTNLLVSGCPVQATASQELGGSRRFGSLTLSRPLSRDTDLLGRPRWSLDVSHLFTRSDAYRVDHTTIALARLLGRYRAALVYSPEGAGEFDGRPWVSAYGYGYTYSGGRHFWLELTASPR
jgi:hypothetical protein